MSRRSYDQPCSLATALDRVGERWSPLIVRELSLGPLRFSELAREVGGAPTDVLTRRLRDLEADGIVHRFELGPPAQATMYELTELGRELERPILELSRWGLNFYRAEDAVDATASMLPSALRVILRPPAEATLTLGLRSEGRSFRLHMEDGWIAASRGEATDADLTLTGDPADLIVALVMPAEPGPVPIEVEGDIAVLEQLRAMVDLPERLRAEAESVIAERAAGEITTGSTFSP